MKLNNGVKNSSLKIDTVNKIYFIFWEIHLSFRSSFGGTQPAKAQHDSA